MLKTILVALGMLALSGMIMMVVIGVGAGMAGPGAGSAGNAMIAVDVIHLLIGIASIVVFTFATRTTEISPMARALITTAVVLAQLGIVCFYVFLGFIFFNR